MATTFEEIQDLIQKHLEERDWTRNPPRSVAISIALEAAELLEHFQWSEESVGDKQALADELADVFIYGFQFANEQGIDIPDAILKKLEKAAKKYPADHFKGKPRSELRATWIQDKLNHRKQSL
ncbi:MAG TPA: MazG-like family protein [Candidatus Limnocylindria bacterium]|nr:MazG-like family protein [Candidatus Limnocylindria bacterium]